MRGLRDTSEDPSYLWSTEYNPPSPQWSLVFVTMPRLWRIGADIEWEPEAPCWPGRLVLAVAFGPWHLTVNRVWGSGQ